MEERTEGHISDISCSDKPEIAGNHVRGKLFTSWTVLGCIPCLYIEWSHRAVHRYCVTCTEQKYFNNFKHVSATFAYNTKQQEIYWWYFWLNYRIANAEQVRINCDTVFPATVCFVVLDRVGGLVTTTRLCFSSTLRWGSTELQIIIVIIIFVF